MDRSRLMIVMGDRAWTQAAIHLACAMSRHNQTEVMLLKMVPVRHPLLLGTDAGCVDFSPEDAANMAATVNDYGASIDWRICQYANYWHAVVDVAEQLGVTAVIIHPSTSALPYWPRFRRWLLNRQLARQQQLLLMLDDLTPSLTWTPSLTLQQTLTAKLDHQHIT